MTLGKWLPISEPRLQNGSKESYLLPGVEIRLKSDNAYKMLIPLPGTEEIVIKVDLLLNIDFLAQCWLIEALSRNFLLLSSPSPQAQEVPLWPQVAGQLFDSHLPTFGSSWASGWGLFINSHHLPSATTRTALLAFAKTAISQLGCGLSCSCWKVCLVLVFLSRKELCPPSPHRGCEWQFLPIPGGQVIPGQIKFRGCWAGQPLFWKAPAQRAEVTGAESPRHKPHT